MSMSLNAAPRAILEGIQDVSTRTPAVLPDLIPTHTPHLFFFAERGDTLPHLLVGDSLTQMYGAKSFDLASEFATHQTVLASFVNAAGNRFFAQRVIPADAAPRATAMLWLDVLETQVPLYERNPDGSVVLDEDGNPVPLLDEEDAPVTAAGTRLKWVLTKTPQYNSEGVIITQQMINDAQSDPEIDIVPVSNAMGQANPMQGDQTDGTNISMRYPIAEFEVSNIGAYGNNVGLRLSAMTAKSPVPADPELSMDIGSFIYRIQFIERSSANATPNIWQTRNGGQDVAFSFKKGAVNTNTRTELYWKKVVLQSYMDNTGPTPVYGPFNRMHVYEANLETIMGMVQTNEVVVDPDFYNTEDTLHMVNLVSGQGLDGNPYHTVEMIGSGGGGVLLNHIASHYASGGSNGTMDFDTFDALVANQVENYGDLEAQMLDSARYPVSAVYDTGFTLETKFKFFVPMGRRKDIAAFVCTQDVSLPQNTIEEESSIAMALRTAARVYPESEIYGTSTCRAFIIGQSGWLIDPIYDGQLPLLVELGAKLATYMGAGNGIWDNGAAIDVSPNNQISLFRDINAAFKPASTYAQDWRNGLVSAQSYDRRSNFIPAFRSVYDNETSVLVNGINVLIACNLQRVAEEVWREMVGNATLTNEQWIERSDALINRKVRNRYDGRVVIQPETYFTEEDETNGFSNHCRIHMYANNMKTQTTFTVVSHRREDLEEGL